VLEQRLGGAMHYRIEADYDLLMAFYERELEPGFSITRYTHGVKIEPANAEGRSIYLYRERGHVGWLLTYFDANAATPEQLQPAGVAEGSAPSGTLPTRPSEFDTRVGQAVEPGEAGGAPTPGGRLQQTEPRMHPRVRRLLQNRPAGSAPQLNFSRGVREPRRSGDAMF
jgi:hypothetical protein